MKKIIVSYFTPILSYVFFFITYFSSIFVVGFTGEIIALVSLVFMLLSPIFGIAGGIAGIVILLKRNLGNKTKFFIPLLIVGIVLSVFSFVFLFIFLKGVVRA